LSWPKLYSQHVSDFMVSDYCVRGKVPSVIHTFICSVCRWASRAIGIFNRGHSGFELWQPLKKLCYDHCRLFRSYINMSKVPIATVKISSNTR
jgi:hypothetical protein